MLSTVRKVVVCLVMLLAIPVFAMAVQTHLLSCGECHRPGLDFSSLDGGVCVACHASASFVFNDGQPHTMKGHFSAGDASNAYNTAVAEFSAVPGQQSSHLWMKFSGETVAAAGATTPTTYARQFNGRYGITRGKLVCFRCHDPHADATVKTSLLKVPVDADQLCLDCHKDWNVNNASAYETHPIIADYSASVAAAPNDYKATPLVNVASGDVRLVNGGVSCTSCHGTHFTDSSSTTVDGSANYNSLVNGDGYILRTDGPLRTGLSRNETAQLRSNLCQTCHAMELHGQTTQMLGCLDCHGGHAYNGGTPNAYILRAQSREPLPTRPGGVNGADAPITFGVYPVGGSTRTKWADDIEGQAGGLCEQCHGDVNAPPLKGMAAEHEAGNTNECTACHRHNDPANLYSFNRDASAATCGQCHGFPPYLNVPGDRQLVPANDGGYAENNSADQGTPYDYLNDSGHFKDETTTGHKVHAGADLPTSPAGSLDWYFVGTAGVDNCKVCHGPDAGASAGGHRTDPLTRPDTFRDIFFDAIAKTGNMTPSYDGTGTYTCSNVYCHTNGAPYGGSRPTRDYTTVNTTPPWVGTGANYAAGGFGAIYNQANRCALCHGNDTATMTSKSNSAVHLAHLGGTTTLNMGQAYSCAVCHVNTALDADTLAVGAMDGSTGGTHVNGLIDVAYQTSGSALYNALAVNAVGVNYDSGTGSCASYCHDPADTGNSVDWDNGTDMQCDTCHGGIASDISGDGGVGPITTGSHSRHFSDTNGPLLTCTQCHGTGADAGTHAGHLDGIVDLAPPVDGVTFNDICEECHGYDADPGEVLPVWGNPASTDCATCHSGTQCGADFNTHTVVTVDYARTSGHNRPTASGAYAQSGNVAANLACLDCHLADSPLHWDGANGDYLMRTDDSFPATYAGNEDSFCANCHGATPGSVNAASVATQAINTHRGKLCVACHNVHGDQNVQMIWLAQADQVSHDPSATGKYAANVLFSNLTDFGVDSYDEDDGAAGGAGEANADDICATCHTVAAGTSHNNADNSTGDHYQGTDCFTCHGGHDDTDAFKVGVGTACNDCHGFPPVTGAHVRHSQSASMLLTEDRSDCAVCHTGADAYTYDLTADIGAALNHSKAAGRKTILNTTVGYNSTNLDCATACHASTVVNGGRWSDTTGLACDACHYYSATPTSAGNAGDLSLSHDEHFDAGKGCTDCHTLDDGAIPTAGPLTHIDDISGADQGAMYTGMATALNDEAAVVRTNMAFGDVNNTCSGTGIGLGCHASGTPDWDIAIPATGAGCLECHTDTDTAAYNPTSGLHDNNPLPTVTGNAHDGSFDDGSAGTADCVTCHTTAPSASHADGTLDSGAAVTVAAVAGYTQGTSTCATTCHSAGTGWNYKWATSAYATNGSECANCHGDYTNGWVTGVAPHTENPTRGSKHNNTGTLTYPCTDCHAIGSASGYNWTSKWDPTGTTSNHGDDKITMNQTAINTFAIDTVPNPDRAGCTTASCHGNDAAHNFTVTTTAFTTATVGGNEPSVLCSSCHGGYAGTSANGYWPDGVTPDEDTAGAHQKHLTALAAQVYSETLAQLLTDNGNGTADAKQKELCSYCHDTPGSDGDHGIAANLPAEVNSMFGMWTKAADNGVYSAAADTCATVDCHFNKTTPDNTYGWYDGNTTGCVMCHVDVNADTAHTAHTGAYTNFGITIVCADCHAATEWGVPGTPPSTGHLNNSYDISGGVAFTYSANTCGTNACHEDGKGGAPADNTYTWGATLADCTICHAATPATSTHAVHVNNGSYVPNSCDDCHTPASNAAHISGDVTYNTATITATAGTTPNITCTNSCHTGVTTEFDGTPGLACTDCHSGSYIGGGSNMPQYAMHTVTATVSGVVHDQTIAGAGGDCAFCHDSLPAAGGTHVDGSFVADGPANTDRGMFTGFTDGATPTCTTACHSAGTSWTYKWSATAANSDGTECANCHGDYTSGWNTGVGHATNPTRGNSTHNDTGNLTYECTGCHVVGATTNNYPWTSATNDWASEGTTLHGNNTIEINNYSATLVRSGTAGCTGCHAANDGSHDFPISSWTPNFVTGDVEAAGGSCDGCHGNQAGNFWPDGNTAGAGVPTADDQAGKHPEHMAAMIAKGIAQSDACGYCHGPEIGSGSYHNNGTATLPQHSAGSWFYKRIIGGGNDTDGVFNAGTNSCATIDCHFNNTTTPHWYTDNVPPAAVTLAAVSGPNPRSIKVSWNAPGDDNNLVNTTPYVYDLRYGTSAAIATDYNSTTNYAGNLPAAYAEGYLSEAVVENLTPATTYYFSLRTQDTAGNWSATSNTISATPTVDTQTPDFGGANKAVKGDEGQAINLYWTSAEDHTMPITYKIWMKDEASGSLDMDVDTPVVTGWTDNKIELNDTHGVLNDTIYHLGVRACDALNNCDTNTQIVSATPTDVPLVNKTYHTYRPSTSTTLVKDGAFGAGVTGATLPRIFAPGANNTYPVKVFVDGFSIYLDNGNNPSTVRVTLGTSTNGTNFTSAGITKDVSVGKRADRVYNFKIGDPLGIQVNSGQRIAVQVSEVTANGVLLNYGSAATRGDVTVAEQIVNIAPVAATNNGTTGIGVGDAMVEIAWNAATDTTDGLSDTIHYDLYGSNNGGTSYDYVIAEGLDAATLSYVWDTQTAGITSGSIAVRVNAGDGYSHTPLNITGLGTADTADYVEPSPIDDLVAKVRPKAGSVQLIWTAPGDDYHNHGRADHYDIRYSTSPIIDGATYNSATECVNEPSPDFGGKIQKFEVTGMIPGTLYYFAIKTYDEAGNGSPLSTAKTAGSDQAVGGPHCGMCHTTAPSVVESVGNHKLHGFTIEDCTKCHGAAVASYGLDHQDGILTMGYGPGGVHSGIISGNRIYYTNDGTPGGTVLYDDTDGFGGFGAGSYAAVGDGVDNGTCSNFGALGVGGCHSAAGSDPDGAGTVYNTISIPTWTSAAYLNCASCHGNPDRTTDTFYNRPFDATAANGGVVTDQVKAAPAVDNHGNYDLAAVTEAERKYIGQHEKHLNYSFRFSKGDSCNLCHEGDYKDGNNLDGKHANGDIDVQLDLTAAGDNAVWTPGTPTTAGTCGSMSPDSCHPSASAPKWDSAQSFDCVGCHGMDGVTPSHVTDPANGVSTPDNGWATDPMAGNCTYCHIGGHPLDDVGGTALILGNSSQVGLSYRSGGIHLKKSIGGRAAQTTEAQLCWSCHDANGISEWGTDTGSNNASTTPANASNYDYGSVTTSNWTTATWSSPVANFAYKTGAIQSTHSTNELGTSAVAGGLEARVETKDTVDLIRCSNCHDVHNLNKAPGDTVSGQPYLRGTWIRNPYPEDGAPWNKAYTGVNNYGAVPRGGIGNNQQGGYQIDQNNGSPTAGLSLATSAGICTLCHGTNVDAMDKTTGEGFWVGTNGHTNAALGGTGSVAANIFGHGIGGRPTPSGANLLDGSQSNADVIDMGVQYLMNYGAGTERAYFYRSKRSTVLNPLISADFAYQQFDWGVSIDPSSIDIGYHAFTCSKCHNPHASRLPKLMITNCLDTNHNTWDNGQGSIQNFWTSTADNGEWTATHNTAQNCHRYDSVDNVGGWNTVTPW